MIIKLHPAPAPLLALPILLGTHTAMSQNDWLQETSSWQETFAYFDGTYFHHTSFRLILDGDTSIGGADYHKLWRIGTDTIYSIGDTMPLAITPLDHYSGALREENAMEQWWVVFAGFTAEELLYDFDLEQGQVLTGTYGDCDEGYTVDAIDSVLIGADWRRRFHIGLWNGYIIEGVGTHAGLFGHLCPFFEEFGCLIEYTMAGDTLEVDGCGQLSQAIPGTPEARSLQLHPNPTSDRCQLGAAFAGALVTLHDPAGRMLSQLRADASGGMDLNALVPGTYLLRVIDGQRAYSTRVVVQ